MFAAITLIGDRTRTRGGVWTAAPAMGAALTEPVENKREAYVRAGI